MTKTTFVKIRSFFVFVFVSVSVVSRFLFRDEDNFCQNAAEFFCFVFIRAAVVFLLLFFVSHFLFPDEHNFRQNVVFLFCSVFVFVFIRVLSSF